MPRATNPERRSQISRHPDRLRIELARTAGVSLDKIAKRFGVHRDAIARHMESLSPEYRGQLVADVPIEELAQRARDTDGSLLDHFAIIRMTLMQQMLAAATCNDRHATAALARAATEVSREIGKLSGEIQRLNPGVTINTTVAIMNSPVFHELETGLIAIARQHPDAKDDIVGLVRRLKHMPEPAGPVIEGRANA